MPPAPPSLDLLLADLDAVPPAQYYGRVTSVMGLMLEIAGVAAMLSVGSRVRVHALNGREVIAEVVGFRAGKALAMPFGDTDGIGLGSLAQVDTAAPMVFPHRAWLGRVVNALAEPIDGKGGLPKGDTPQLVKGSPPPAHARKRVGEKIDVGVRVLNTFTPCCRGQRMGIFAGSGVGKSSLLSMIARYTRADVNVIGLVGERGREVQEFIEESLGAEGLAKSVLVVATSDEPPLMRRQAAYMTLAIAEYFRDQGKDVLCMMDSVTRFAMAQREIGLSAGEPPASKGYTPTVFTELPRLLERAGPGTKKEGSITGLFTVLVEGDDTNEPISDAVRGILDGHIILSRTIAERGRFPAVDVLKSVSRMLPGCNNADENKLLKTARRLLSAYENMAELIRMGAYKAGSDNAVDEAIFYNPGLEQLLSQGLFEPCTIAEGQAALASLLGSIHHEHEESRQSGAAV
jgi:flagellum-specific ATP synthase